MRQTSKKTIKAYHSLFACMMQQKKVPGRLHVHVNTNLTSKPFLGTVGVAACWSQCWLSRCLQALVLHVSQQSGQCFGDIWILEERRLPIEKVKYSGNKVLWPPFMLMIDPLQIVIEAKLIWIKLFNNTARHGFL